MAAPDLRQPAPARQVTLIRQLDERLWTTWATVPLFAHPTLVATAQGVRGVQLNPTAA